MHQLLQKYMGIPVTPHNTRQHHGSTPPPVTGHAPPTTTNVVHMPPPPLSSCQHSHIPSAVHKCVMQFLQLAHVMMQETPQRCVAMPTAEEGTSTHATSPKGPKASVPCWHAWWRHRVGTALWPNTDAMVWRCTAPHHVHGAHAPCIQGKPSHCAEAHDADHMDWPGCNPPMTTTATIETHQSHPFPPLSTGSKGPGVAHKHTMPIIPFPMLACHHQPMTSTVCDCDSDQRAPPAPLNHHPLGCNTQVLCTSARWSIARDGEPTTMMTRCSHSDQSTPNTSPLPPSTGPKGPGAVHKHVVPITDGVKM